MQDDPLAFFVGLFWAVTIECVALGGVYLLLRYIGG